MYNFVIFNTFTELFNRCHDVISEHFINVIIPQTQATTIPSVSVDWPFLDISYKWNHTTHGPLCLASSTMCKYFQGPSTLSGVSELHSFLWLNNPLHGYVIFYLSIHQLIEFGSFLLFCYNK